MDDEEFLRFQAEIGSLVAEQPEPVVEREALPPAGPKEQDVAFKLGNFLSTGMPAMTPVALPVGSTVERGPTGAFPPAHPNEYSAPATAGPAMSYGAMAGFAVPPPVPRPAAAAPAPGAFTADPKKQKSTKPVLRGAAGQIWVDNTLKDWPEGDIRLFCGDLGNEVTDEILTHAFSKYKSFAMGRVIRDKFSRKSKGFGFVSFMDFKDAAAALREMHGKYVGNRPIKLRRATVEERDLKTVRKKEKEHKKEMKKLLNAITGGVPPS